jgi:hypothetical protein
VDTFHVLPRWRGLQDHRQHLREPRTAPNMNHQELSSIGGQVPRPETLQKAATRNWQHRRQSPSRTQSDAAKRWLIGQQSCRKSVASCGTRFPFGTFRYIGELCRRNSLCRRTPNAQIAGRQWCCKRQLGRLIPPMTNSFSAALPATPIT